jgi:hypothetical protein
MTDYTPQPNTSIIHATHRPQDLIPAFLDELRQADPAAYEELMVLPFPIVPSYVMDEGDSSDWWTSEECTYALSLLFDLLDGCAPDGCYFGAHPGDGSDFGYWESEQ